MIDTDTIEGKIEVMAAFAAGKTIEGRERYHALNSWSATASPAWDWYNNEYRIAPEPLEFHVVVDRDGRWVYAYTDINDARALVRDQDTRRADRAPHRVVLVREVLP